MSRPKPRMTGNFPVEQAPPSRNFLSENKKSLRSLEQTTAEKLAAREPVRPRWMPPMRRAGTEIGEWKAGGRPQQNTRESSLVRNRLNSCSHQQLGVGAAESGQRVGRQEQRAPVYYDHSEEAAQSSDCNSCGTRRNSATNTATQTEDISDELYLTNALRKCSFDGASLSNRCDYSEDEEQQPQQSSCKHAGNFRDEVRLPRFLEKDEEQCEPGPECMLTEQARVGDLKSAQQRCDGLISELNRMPITSQSLWVRSRRAEIDKELAIVDEQIRVYSKPKLYNSTKYK
ncbi:uncharacterized protein LOC117896464 [Drosophila subobscura]|uniref:uncharacterized protein LOC117896464 n=1 Tax=Drosophila subobscura TaxID=7241 RepID=UPI00155AD495|nr:uncharacterized protein LOC117896464 [Drosophila subobscura]